MTAFTITGVPVDADGRIRPRAMTTAELIAALVKHAEDDRYLALVAEAKARAQENAFPRWRLAIIDCQHG
jgi:hypothetical protein